MPQNKAVEWGEPPNRSSRFKQLAQHAGQTARVRYWFPHVPLSLALAFSGLVLLWIVYTLQQSVLLADFPKHILDFRPSSMPFVLIGVAMLIMSVGLLFRSRFAWMIAILLTASTVLSAAIVGHGRHHELIYFHGILLIALLLTYRWFDRSSLAAGTLFAVTSMLLLLIYAVFGSLYLGKQFSPPIKDLMTAFYYSVVTMATVGYGDIVPKGTEARLFAASVIILGLAVFATSVTAIATPMIARLTTRKEKRMKHTGHFIVIGATPLAYNTYREFKKRQQDVVFILPRDPESGEIDPADLIVGDANSLEILRKANADKAQAVLAMRVDDSDNAFIVLAVKELKGSAKTVVAINDSKHMERIKLVQPDMIIAPEVLGGELLAMMLSGEPITGDFVMQRFLHFDRTTSDRGS
ncbi:MAG: voltage-gated potassium channel protein [Candidatus Acidiferrales bacterium]